MKKLILLTVISLTIVGSIFADNITNGVLPVPTDTAGKQFFVEAKASETEQGLLLKYGDTAATAVLVNETITKSSTESWNVFGNEETKSFYFFGTGRASGPKTVGVTASASTFQNGTEDTGVQPTITGYDAANGWSITIAAANPVGTGQDTGTNFTVAWDGTNSANINTTPAGTYTTTITLVITEP